MIIILNREKRKFNGPLTVAELLRILNLRSQQVLVERNFCVVHREELTDTEVMEGDRIEILRLVGGI